LTVVVTASRAGATPRRPPNQAGPSTAAPSIRDDEFRAVLDVFPSNAGIRRCKSREYTLCHADIGNEPDEPDVPSALCREVDQPRVRRRCRWGY
jgi:hypothetical protein